MCVCVSVLCMMKDNLFLKSVYVFGSSLTDGHSRSLSFIHFVVADSSPFTCTHIHTLTWSNFSNLVCQQSFWWYKAHTFAAVILWGNILMLYLLDLLVFCLQPLVCPLVKKKKSTNLGKIGMCAYS